MIFKQFINAREKSIEHKKELVLMVKPFFPLLKNGLYYVDYVSRIIYRWTYFKKYKQETMHTYDGYHSSYNSTRRFRRIISLLIHNRPFLVFHMKNTYSYSLVIISHGKDTIKLFDYKNKHVASFYFDSTLKNINFVNKKRLYDMGYNVPKTIIPDAYITSKNGQIEEMIEKKDYNHEQGIIHWIDRISKFNNNKYNMLCDKNDLSLRYNSILNYLIANNFSQEVELFNKFVDDNCYIIKPCHGDFYPLNYIFDGKEYYAIDYEFSCNKIFFYDFIIYLCKCFIMYKEVYLLEKYFNGAYDESLVIFFKSNNVSFASNAKLLYLIVGLIEMYNFRFDSGFDYTSKLILDKFNIR